MDMSRQGLPTGNKVRLRTLMEADVDILDLWENDPRVWGASDLSALEPDDRPPFSREILRRLIENQQYDINRTGQARFVVCSLSDSGRPVGFVDLFDFDPAMSSAGVGVLIYEPVDRRRGYASDALGLLCGYAARNLGLRMLWCMVAADNVPSCRLFRASGFVEANELSHRDGRHVNEIFFRKVLPILGTLPG